MDSKYLYDTMILVIKIIEYKVNSLTIYNHETNKQEMKISKMLTNQEVGLKQSKSS